MPFLSPILIPFLLEHLQPSSELFSTPQKANKTYLQNPNLHKHSPSRSFLPPSLSVSFYLYLFIFTDYLSMEVFSERSPLACRITSPFNKEIGCLNFFKTTRSIVEWGSCLASHGLLLTKQAPWSINLDHKHTPTVSLFPSSWKGIRQSFREFFRRHKVVVKEPESVSVVCGCERDREREQEPS